MNNIIADLQKCPDAFHRIQYVNGHQEMIAGAILASGQTVAKAFAGNESLIQGQARELIDNAVQALSLSAKAPRATSIYRG